MNKETFILRCYKCHADCGILSREAAAACRSNHWSSETICAECVTKLGLHKLPNMI